MLHTTDRLLVRCILSCDTLCLLKNMSPILHQLSPLPPHILRPHRPLPLFLLPILPVSPLFFLLVHLQEKRQVLNLKGIFPENCQSLYLPTSSVYHKRELRREMEHRHRQPPPRLLSINRRQ